MDFVFPRSKDVSFPPNGMGSTTLNRKTLVDDLSNLVLKGNNQSLYIRGPAGSGKSFLLNLMGRRLKELGYRVIFLAHAGLLNDFKTPQLLELENTAMTATDPLAMKVFFVVDEVHQNPSSPLWDFLLKMSKHIVTIGAGIPRTAISPHFQLKLEPRSILFAESELDECIASFATIFPEYPRDVLSSVLQWALETTGGQSYPFLKLSEYLLRDHKDSCIDGSFENLFLNVDLNSHPLLLEVKNRAYNDPRSIALSCDFMSSMGKEFYFEKMNYLIDCGYWDPSSEQFVSQLFVWICLAVVKKDNALHVDWDNKDEALQQVILHGMSRMKESDFFDNSVNKYRIENSISFSFAYHMASIKQLNVRTQVRVSSSRRKVGHPPTIDFYLNGRLGCYLEVVRNGHKLEEHFDRFESVEGSYHRHVNEYGVLNIELLNEGEPKVPPRLSDAVRNKLFTFVMPLNTLYRNKRVVATNVSPHLNKSPGIVVPPYLASSRTLYTIARRMI